MEDGPETSGYGGKETCQSPITQTDQDRNDEGLIETTIIRMEKRHRFRRYFKQRTDGLGD